MMKMMRLSSWWNAEMGVSAETGAVHSSISTVQQMSCPLIHAALNLGRFNGAYFFYIRLPTKHFYRI